MVLRGERQIEVAMEDRQRRQPGTDRRRAVIAALQRNDVLFRGAARGVVVVRDESQRGIDGIGSPQREIHMLQRCRRQFDQFRGKLDGGLRAEMEVARRIGQARHLPGGRVDDALMPIAGVDAPEPGECVEQFLAVCVAQENALRGFEYGHASRFMRAIADDGMDQMFAIGFDERGIRHGSVSGSGNG